MTFVNHTDHTDALFKLSPDIAVIPIGWLNRESGDRRQACHLDTPDEELGFPPATETAVALWNAYLNAVGDPVEETAKAMELVGFGVAYLAYTDKGWAMVPAAFEELPDAMLVSGVDVYHAEDMARAYVEYLNNL